MNRKAITRIFTGILVLSLLSCSKVPITGRRQMHLLPASTMLSMSFSNYKSFLDTNQVVPASNPEAEMVTRVGTKLENATVHYMDTHGYSKVIKNYKWEFHLVKSSEINAWCMPGGKIVVYTGIIPLVQNDTGLAVVLGHEIGHAIARHGNERMSAQLLEQLGGVSLSLALQNKPAAVQNIFSTAYGATSQVGILAFSRKQESEADKIGLVLMAEAGYDPRYALKFWQRMEAATGSSNGPVFLQTHPSNAKRIADLKAFMPTALQYYYNKNI